MAAIRRHQPVVGLQAGGVALRLRLFRIAEISNPDFAALEQGVGKLVTRHIGQANHFRELAWRVFGRHFGKQLQRFRIKRLDAAWRVVLRDNNPAILRNRAADGIPGLDDAFDDFRFKQINLGQPAIPAEDEGIAAIAGINGGGMRKIAQPIDTCVSSLRTGIDQRDATGGALNNQPKIAGAFQLRTSAGGQ